MVASERRRILYLLPFAPRLDATHGGGRVIAQLLARMVERHDLALLYMRAPNEPPIDQALAMRCAVAEEVMRPGVGETQRERWLRRIQLAGGFARGRPMQVTDWQSTVFASRLRKLLKHWQPDIIQIEYHIMAQYAALCTHSLAPCVLTEYEPGVAAAQERLAEQQRPSLTTMLDTHAWRQFEPMVLRQMQAVVVFSERDCRALAPFVGATPLVQIPLGVPLPALPLNALGVSPVRLLFVGSFIHGPNEDAARRLIQDIFPRVQAACPEATLVIVGDQPPADLRALANKHVIITGRVPDVTPFLDEAALVVVPLRLGGGMRVKVLEALAAGKAVVASPLAVEGLAVTTGQHVVLADSDEAFAAAILQLLAAPEQRATIASQARAWALANLDWDKPVAAYEALHQQILASCK